MGKYFSRIESVSEARFGVRKVVATLSGNYLRVRGVVKAVRPLFGANELVPRVEISDDLVSALGYRKEGGVYLPSGNFVHVFDLSYSRVPRMAPDGTQRVDRRGRPIWDANFVWSVEGRPLDPCVDFRFRQILFRDLVETLSAGSMKVDLADDGEFSNVFPIDMSWVGKLRVYWGRRRDWRDPASPPDYGKIVEDLKGRPGWGTVRGWIYLGVPLPGGQVTLYQRCLIRWSQRAGLLYLTEPSYDVNRLRLGQVLEATPALREFVDSSVRIKDGLRWEQLPSDLQSFFDKRTGYAWRDLRPFVEFLAPNPVGGGALIVNSDVKKAALQLMRRDLLENAGYDMGVGIEDDLVAKLS